MRFYLWKLSTEHTTPIVYFVHFNVLFDFSPNENFLVKFIGKLLLMNFIHFHSINK